MIKKRDFPLEDEDKYDVIICNFLIRYLKNKSFILNTHGCVHACM
jgi:hypothetical protein